LEPLCFGSGQEPLSPLRARHRDLLKKGPGAVFGSNCSGSIGRTSQVCSSGLASYSLPYSWPWCTSNMLSQRLSRATAPQLVPTPVPLDRILSRSGRRGTTTRYVCSGTHVSRKAAVLVLLGLVGCAGPATNMRQHERGRDEAPIIKSINTSNSEITAIKQSKTALPGIGKGCETGPVAKLGQRATITLGDEVQVSGRVLRVGVIKLTNFPTGNCEVAENEESLFLGSECGAFYLFVSNCRPIE
jgi:hypothetical protein